MRDKERKDTFRENVGRTVINAIIKLFFPWLYSRSRTLAVSHIGSFFSYFRHMVRLPRRVISPSHGLYLHRTTRHRKTRTNIHALSGIRTHDPSNQPAKTHASDHTDTVTGILKVYRIILNALHINAMQSLLHMTLE
jgi:hypothetical protein